MAGVTLESAIGFPPDNASLQAGDIVHDAAGNAYLSGSLLINTAPGIARIDLDPGNPAPDDPAIVETNNTIAFVAKYDAGGAFQWVRTLAAAATGQQLNLQELEIGGSGSLYFNGTYRGDFEMESVVLPNVGNGNPDRFIGKLDPDGSVEWLKGIDLGYVGASTSPGLAVDETNGRLYVTGVEALSFFAAQSRQGVVINVDISGAAPLVVSHVVLQGSEFAKPNDLAIDASGSVFVAGTYQGTADFNPGSGKLSISSGSGSPEAGFVWKLTPDLNLGWAKVFAGSKTNNSGAQQIAVDSFGSILVSGSFRGTIDFNPDKAVSSLTSNGVSDAYLVKLTPAGALSYAKRHGGAGLEGTSAMTLDAAGNIYLVGSTFIAKFQDNGTLLWNQNIAAAGSSSFPVQSRSISVSPAGTIHTTGIYQGSLNADADPEAELDSLDDTFDLFWLIYGQT